MIELNLLERKEVKKLPIVAGIDLNKINIPMVVGAIIFFYASSTYYTAYYEEILAQEEAVASNVREMNKKIEADIKSKEAKKKELEAYSEQLKKAQVRSMQIEEILKTRTNPKKILEVIARTIPTAMTIENLIIDKSDNISLSGTSYDSRAIGDFIAAMNDTPYFGRSITPTSQENAQEERDGVSVRIDRFELAGSIKNYDMRAK